MEDIKTEYLETHPVHDWLKTIHLHYIPGQRTPLLEQFITGLLTQFEASGHVVQPSADEDTDVLLTTAAFGQVINWRRSLMLTGRLLLKLEHTPVAITAIHITSPGSWKSS